MILLVDHNDSFTNNLSSWFQFHSKYELKNINCHDIAHIQNFSDIQAVIFSPGPGHPLDYPESISLYQRLPDHLPFLGICLGHQLMLASHGALICRSEHYPIHGRQVTIKKSKPCRVLSNYVFNGSFVLYNSLCCFKEDPVFLKEIQSIFHEKRMNLIAEHRTKPHVSVQFHPESFASLGGHDFLIRFLHQFHL